MNYKEEFIKINRQIFELEKKRRQILAQAVEAKGLKYGTKFKINNSWCFENKIFQVVSEVNFQQLKKDGTINKSVNINRFDFRILDDVEIIKE